MDPIPPTSEDPDTSQTNQANRTEPTLQQSIMQIAAQLANNPNSSEAQMDTYRLLSQHFPIKSYLYTGQHIILSKTCWICFLMIMAVVTSLALSSLFIQCSTKQSLDRIEYILNNQKEPLIHPQTPSHIKGNWDNKDPAEVFNGTYQGIQSFGTFFNTSLPEYYSCYSRSINDGIWRLTITSENYRGLSIGVIDDKHRHTLSTGKYYPKQGSVVFIPSDTTHFQQEHKVEARNIIAESGSQVSVELNMKKGRLDLFIDGQRQGTSLYSIPPIVRFAVGLHGRGRSFSVVGFEELVREKKDERREL
ncbi:hypothetical protein BLNAU_2271 [Blattamonas nauphoetae]|uniref:Uncharacterized protein n=1 Tax=Blattamonas nauphoetae TaxID=2049346 RepID=A0ABQ9YGE1_9EUKA|nr:hypothetical protein BLNAU_2271 [Blattamonas nauphoetae]